MNEGSSALLASSNTEQPHNNYQTMYKDESEHLEDPQIVHPTTTTGEMGIIDDQKAGLSALEVQYTRKEEGRLLRKLDLNLLTYVSALYLLAFLDRGNIGNANTAGMSKDLGMTSGQYQWLLTIFYISYITFEWLILLWKVFPPRYYVPCVVIGWGIISSCNAAVQSWQGMMVLRFFLGVTEAGFGPGVPYYLTFFYYRHELGWRTGIFMAMSPIGSAFAGALAYGITKNDNMAIASWRVLFLVEGLPTIAVGLLAFWVLPSNITECRFLDDRDKQIGNARTARQTGDPLRGGHKINIKEVLVSFFDPKNLIPGLMFFSINVSFSSLPVFLPAIIEAMGFTSVRAQGLSAIPYVVTAIICLLSAWYSDKFKMRGPFITVISTVGAAGFLILALSHTTAVRYFAVFLASAGVFPCVAILLTWVGNNQGTDSKRGAGYVLLQVFGQCGPLLGTRIFPATDAPYYKKGMWISFAFLALVALLSIVLIFYLKFLNKKLDEKYGPAEGDPTNVEDQLGLEGEDNPNYRYII